MWGTGPCAWRPADGSDKARKKVPATGRVSGPLEFELDGNRPH